VVALHVLDLEVAVHGSTEEHLTELPLKSNARIPQLMRDRDRHATHDAIGEHKAYRTCDARGRQHAGEAGGRPGEERHLHGDPEPQQHAEAEPRLHVALLLLGRVVLDARKKLVDDRHQHKGE